MSNDVVFEEVIQATIERFWETVPPVWNRIRGNVRGIASEQYEMSVEQFHILRHIRKGLSSVSELAEVRQISRPAISQAVDGLVERGLISRHQDEVDRRYVNLALTASGDALLNVIFRQNRAWMAEKMAGLSADQLDAVCRGLEILKAAFDPAEI